MQEAGFPSDILTTIANIHFLFAVLNCISHQWYSLNFLCKLWDVYLDSIFYCLVIQGICWKDYFPHWISFAPLLTVSYIHVNLFMTSLLGFIFCIYLLCYTHIAWLLYKWSLQLDIVNFCKFAIQYYISELLLSR